MIGCSSCEKPKQIVSVAERRALWFALFANATMFVVEIIGSYAANSVSVKADAIDFFGDSANYAVTLFLISKAVQIRAKASMAKGFIMGSFGIWVLVSAFSQYREGTLPQADFMGFLGLAALVTNLGVAAVLFRFRDGDSNMRSVWLCSRNDAIGNLLVIVSAIFVHYYVTNIPDLIVACIMAFLGLQGAAQVIRVANKELKENQLKLVS
jgi:Co/Zn/Cd efflux system component